MDPEPVRVLHLTDTHLLADPTAQWGHAHPAAALKQVLASIRHDPWRPDLCLVSGDLAEDGSDAAYVQLRDALDSLGVPVRVVPGNHDDPQVMRRLFSEGPVRWSRTIDAGAWRILLLDSQLIGQARGRLGPEELAALDSSLRAEASRPTLVVLHHPIAAVCPMPSCQLEGASEFIAIVQRYPQVRAAIAGHTHCPDDRAVEGVRSLVTPSTCLQAEHPSGKWQGEEPPFLEVHRVDATRRGYRRLELFADGSIGTEVMWVGREEE